jgi:hypothetical protein
MEACTTAPRKTGETHCVFLALFLVFLIVLVPAFIKLSAPSPPSPSGFQSAFFKKKSEFRPLREFSPM